MRKWIILLIVLYSAGLAAAQSTGQVYVQTFEDRNGNGMRDAGEPQLTGGIAVNLLNADGIVVASALLDDSPNAARGLVGFQQMRPGDYSIEINSAQYTATTPTTFNITVNDSGVPEVLLFGAQPALAAADATPADAAAQGLPSEILGLDMSGVDPQMMQIAAASIGTVTTLCGMIVLGFVLYLLTLHRAMNRALKADARSTTMGMRAVSTTSTGTFPTVQKKTSTGQQKPVKGSTGQFKPPSQATGQFRPPKSSTEQFRPPNAADDDK